jgi:hypothetical protein
MLRELEQAKVDEFATNIRDTGIPDETDSAFPWQP